MVYSRPPLLPPSAPASQVANGGCPSKNGTAPKLSKSEPRARGEDREDAAKGLFLLLGRLHFGRLLVFFFVALELKRVPHSSTLHFVSLPHGVHQRVKGRLDGSVNEHLRPGAGSAGLGGR